MTKASLPLLVALSGAAVAFVMVTAHVALFVLVVLPVAAGWFALRAGKHMAAKDPVRSLVWLSWARLEPYGLATAASALLIGLAVWLAPPQSAEEATTKTAFDTYWPEIVKVLAGALSTFLTAAFIKSTEDPDAWVADTTRETFQDAFKGKLTGRAELALRNAEFDGEGWGAKGRLLRAKAIALALGLPGP